MEGNIRIYRLPKAISFPLVRTTTQGQSVYPDIALYCVTIVFIALKTKI